MNNVIFIAPPASGKGSQSILLENLGYVHLSTGDMLREEINKKTPLGIEVDKVISQGNLVNDDIIFEILKNKLMSNSKPFILDGYPRTYHQVELLDNLFKELNISNYEVIYLDVSLNEALKRALGRLTCECGASFNKFIDEYKPQKEGICDKCGKKLTERKDDNEESFKVRFTTFLANIEPIKEFYQKKNKLHIVNAMRNSEEIAEEIKEILNDKYKK